MYKQFNEENQNIYEFTANKNYVKNQSNLTRFNFISASSHTLSASYYHFARINFYLSGSDLSLNEKRFNKIQTPGNLQNNDLTHFNKFYQEGSLVFVPQNEFGDTIKKGTFVLRDNSTDTEIKIIDDLNGNLYAPDATFSQSVSALSSSDNYVGNVFYDIGAFTITETASFDGTNDYKDVTSGNYRLNYQGARTLTTYDWTCELLPNEMNLTENITIFKPSEKGKLKDNLTSSLFPTFITEVGLYDDNQDLMGYARLSKPIPKSTSIPMRFFVRMDY